VKHRERRDEENEERERKSCGGGKDLISGGGLSFSPLKNEKGKLRRTREVKFLRGGSETYITQAKGGEEKKKGAFEEWERGGNGGRDFPERT